MSGKRCSVEVQRCRAEVQWCSAVLPVPRRCHDFFVCHDTLCPGHRLRGAAERGGEGFRYPSFTLAVNFTLTLKCHPSWHFTPTSPSPPGSAACRTSLRTITAPSPGGGLSPVTSPRHPSPVNHKPFARHIVTPHLVTPSLLHPSPQVPTWPGSPPPRSTSTPWAAGRASSTLRSRQQRQVIQPQPQPRGEYLSLWRGKAPSDFFYFFFDDLQ